LQHHQFLLQRASQNPEEDFALHAAPQTELAGMDFDAKNHIFELLKNNQITALTCLGNLLLMYDHKGKSFMHFSQRNSYLFIALPRIR
jgi:hypothetical protein